MLRINKEGSRFWYNSKGELHRENGPAVEKADGHKEWWVNGLYHRVDAPAVERIDGGNCWFLNGVRHRDNGPALESYKGNNSWYRAWYLNGDKQKGNTNVKY
jgi:hypothetical protein